MNLTRGETLFLFVAVSNVLAASVYLIWGLFFSTVGDRQGACAVSPPDNRTAYLLRFFIMILCPVAGPAFFLLAQGLYLTVFRFQVDLEDVIFCKDRVRTQVRAEEERERNLVPAEEAVAIGDRHSLRMAMMNMIKGDTQRSLASIALALNAEDPEAAHYAASALSGTLNEFRTDIHKRYRKIQEEAPDETEGEEQMLDHMDDILKQGVFTRLEQDRFVRMMERTAELLFEKDPLKLTPRRYEAVCLRLLETEDFVQCEKWCLRQAEQYPEKLSSFTCFLKLYFTTGNREDFFRTLVDLKRSETVIDRETLELIRIFDEGERK